MQDTRRFGTSFKQKYQPGTTPVEKDTYQRELMRVRQDIDHRQQEVTKSKDNAKKIMESYSQVLKFGQHFEKVDDSDNEDNLTLQVK